MSRADMSIGKICRKALQSVKSAGLSGCERSSEECHHLGRAGGGKLAQVFVEIIYTGFIRHTQGQLTY